MSEGLPTTGGWLRLIRIARHARQSRLNDGWARRAVLGLVLVAHVIGLALVDRALHLRGKPPGSADERGVAIIFLPSSTGSKVELTATPDQPNVRESRL